MSGKRRNLSIVSDPRYLDLIKRYDADWDLACAELLGIVTDFQQRALLSNVSKKSSRTSASSGHGTGKSFITAAMILIFMILYPGARVVVIANKIRQVMDAVWKNLKEHFKALKRRFPWIAQYFVLTETSFYERTNKGVWYVSPKGFRLNQEESLAGEHADHMLTIVDEASGVNDRAFGVIMGAQTSKDNRVLLLSQPTRVGGYFYRTHHDLSKSMSHDGTWVSIIMSSALSKHVTKEFILDKLKEYGGFDSPEFQIKVLGLFPKNMSDFLLGRDDVQAIASAAARRAVAAKLGEGWGWMATVDVGGGRDRSVINISRVYGAIGPTRIVVNHRLLEMPADIDPAVFCRRIVAECCSGQYPNITIVIDGDGAGHQVHSIVSELAPDHNVVRLRWGFAPKMPAAKRRFLNLRAMAHIYTKEAALSGRLAVDSDPKTVDQMSKLPIRMNEQGLWYAVKKELMRSKMQIPSPDRSDTYCFFQIVDYIPHDELQDIQDKVVSDDEEWLTQSA